jgi:hypothetical protein
MRLDNLIEKKKENHKAYFKKISNNENIIENK